MKFGVVIAAGGSGTRFGTDMPKQFVDLCGEPVISHTIAKFQKSPSISQIVIATHKDYLVFCSDVANSFGFSKVTSIIEGGQTRQQSVLKGLKALSKDIDHVLIHDAARPLVSVETIEKCCMETAKYGACAAGTTAIDTIKISEDGEFVDGTIDRSKIWQIQTPQCFNKEFILKCHKNAAFEGIEATDDCFLAEYYGAKIKLVDAGRENIKITNYSDLAVAEVLLND